MTPRLDAPAVVWLAFFTACVTPAREEWVRHIEREAGFSVLMPRSATRSAGVFPSAKGPVLSVSLKASIGDCRYEVIHNDPWVFFLEEPDPDLALDRVVEGLLKPHRTNKVLRVENISIRGQPGRFLRVERSDLPVFLEAAVYSVSAAMYELLVAGPLGGCPRQREFFETFELLPESGE